MNKLFLINGRFLSQKLTGVHRYAFEMCNALHDMGINFIVIAPNRILDEYVIDFPIVQVGKLSSHFWEQIELPLYVQRHFKKTLLINFTG